MNYIYKITQIENNHCYIGFTNNFNRRKKEHINAARVGVKDNVLYRAIRKYGLEKFSWEIIYQSLDHEYTKNFIEPYLIKYYQSNDGSHGYNSTCGGDGVSSESWTPEMKQKVSEGLKKRFREHPESHGMKGKKHSKKSLQMMSETHLNMSQETKDKIGLASHIMWEKPESRKKALEHIQNPSEETKKKMSLAQKGKPSWNKGKTWSLETIEKMRLAKLGKHVSQETKKKMSLSGGIKLAKDFIFMDPNGNKIEIHNLSKFSREHGLNQGLMNSVYLGKRNHHKGYRKYIEVTE
jgi:group I intron endonuclease